MSESVAHLPFLKKRVAATPAPKEQKDPLHIDLPKPQPLRPPPPRKPGDPPPRKPTIAKPGSSTARPAGSKAPHPNAAPPKPDPAAEAEAKRLKKLQRLAALGDAAAITPEARAQLQAAQQAAEKARQQEAAAKQRAEQLAARQQQLKQQQQAAAAKQQPQQPRGPAGSRQPAAGPASKLGSGPGRPGLSAGSGSRPAPVDPWERFTEKQRAFLKVKQRQQTREQALHQGRTPPPLRREDSGDAYDEDLDEYDDDFIDDGPGGSDWRTELRRMTGYDPNRFRGERFDDRSMVASAREIEAEERRSARMARAEDEKEEEEERRRAEAKAKKRKRGGFLDD